MDKVKAFAVVRCFEQLKMKNPSGRDRALPSAKGGVIQLHTTVWYDDELQPVKIVGGEERMTNCSGTNRIVVISRTDNDVSQHPLRRVVRTSVE